MPKESPLHIPFAYRPMAYLGILINGTYFVFTILQVAWNLLEKNTDAVPEVLRATALQFQNSLAYIPLSLVAIFVSIGLLRRDQGALRRLKYLVIGCIVFDLATGLAEARYSLDGSTSGAVDALITSIGILINVCIYAYWERDLVLSYMKDYKSIQATTISSPPEILRDNIGSMVFNTSCIAVVFSVILTIGWFIGALANASSTLIGWIFFIQIIACVLAIITAFLAATKYTDRRKRIQAIAWLGVINLLFSIAILIIGLLSS